MYIEDTIAAIATALGPAGIGVVRISGNGSLDSAGRLFQKDLADTPSHTAHHGFLLHPETGEHIDEVVYTVFRGPKSYTGEDTVEISCHGGAVTVKKVLECAICAGARLAEPGEFTKRAFLNGRMDLVQAEAVNDLIKAHSEQARRIALAQLDGSLSEKIRETGSLIMQIIAQIEAAIDFPDDVPDPEQDEVKTRLFTAKEATRKLIATFEGGRVARDGIRMVLAGGVNVGKSSLLNALLRHARSIVTEVAGTTRDVVEDRLEIEGIAINAADTAGIRETEDTVEKEGVARSMKKIDEADLVVIVIAADEAERELKVPLKGQLEDKRTIVVVNKADLVDRDALQEITLRLQKTMPGTPVVTTCAKTGSHIEDLEHAIYSTVMTGDFATDAAVVSNSRHKEALVNVHESLENSIAALRDGEPMDILSVDLFAAKNELGKINGETAAEDLLDIIFSQFCIGK